VNSNLSSTEQIERLGKRLQDALESRKSLEVHYERDVSALSAFISRLATVCQGIDDDLDHRLSKARALLQKKASIDDLLPLLDDISVLVQSIAVRTQQQLRQTHDVVQQTGKALQQLKGLSRADREQLRELINAVEGPTASLSKYTPLLLHLLEIYGRVVEQTKPAPKEGLLYTPPD